MPAKAKLAVLGPTSSALADRSRSLNFEHVSPVELIWQEISRRTPVGFAASCALNRGDPVPDQLILGVMRRWYWARKPDAGFVLADFPATLLQAKVFDEWLDARGMTLTACAVYASTNGDLINHYRTHGVDLIDAVKLSAA